MALTQGNWSTSSSNGIKVMECTVTSTTAENDSYTLRTPKSLDPTKPWTVVINAAGATIDGSTLPCDLWIGTSDDAVLSGNDSSVVGTDAYEFKTIEADVKASVGSLTCDPNLSIADVKSSIILSMSLFEASLANPLLDPFELIRLDDKGTDPVSLCEA